MSDNKEPTYHDMDPDNYTINNFDYIFKSFGLPNVIVEIGCYYGKTTATIVKRLAPQIPNLQYYAIDPFSTSIDVGEDLEEVYQIFIKNLNSFPYKDNIIFLKEKSFDALIKLRSNKISPQLIYIDGDHTAGTVLSDLVLSFDILAPGGVIICDDSTTWKYKDKSGNEDPQMSPRMAVESFIMCNWSKIKPIGLPAGNQTAFIKK
jgi:predicted O-methyltransferase YrrM